MGKKKDALANRAWRLLRLALTWARKGGLFKQGLLSDMRSYLKSLHAGSSDRIHYGERQFSFDETPAFRFRLHARSSKRLLRFPCISPPVDDDDDDDDGSAFLDRGRQSFLCWDEVAEEESGGDSCPVEELEEGVDARAEEFIARFHEQMKLQRQISLLQYNEMMYRSIS